MLYLGIDQHARQITISLRDESGDVLQSRQVSTRPDKIHAFFQRYDLLLTPSLSVAAFPAERLIPEHWEQHPWDWLRWAGFSYPFNLTGQPAATCPCGFTPAGLPVGLQIVAGRLRDRLVLQASRAFEMARPWGAKRPAVAQ